jgi:hypothetical protein
VDADGAPGDPATPTRRLLQAKRRARRSVDLGNPDAFANDGDSPGPPPAGTG